jgi:predicted RND superfamily exporter protein
VLATILFASQLSKLEWETDARVYLPKGHPAIKYDEKIERIFGAKDAIIITVVNEDKSVFNRETLAKIKRITEKISALPGVIARRALDVASLSTATLFEGDENSMGAARLMENVPQDEQGIKRLKRKIEEHKDILVGNLISADGTAAMIRAKLKEGAVNRYQTYWQIKGIIAGESGGGQAWGNWNGGQQWPAGDGGEKKGSAEWPSGGNSGGTGQGWQQWQNKKVDAKEDNGDRFYIAGRPAIEVTSGLNALKDMKVMIPLLIAVMSIALFLVFKTGRGVVLPITVMGGAIVWTMGTMAMMNIPMYTISTMLPVILVAVGIGDSVHFLSSYYNKVLENPHRKSSEIVAEVLGGLNGPLITTSLTTAIGFMALLFAEMPPFRIFGLFTVLGIAYSWFLTITFIAAMLSIMKPKVAGYLERKRSLRLHEGQDALTRVLVGLGKAIVDKPARAIVATLIVVIVMGYGAGKLYVNSSWMSDFNQDSEVVRATSILNKKFNGSITLNVVLEAANKDAFKSPELLNKVEGLQKFAEKIPLVGDTLSIVDYLKSLNKTLHSMDEAYNRIPQTKSEIAEGLYLYSVSGQPELLDEMVDYDYQNANVIVMIKTDETRQLRNIINQIDGYAKKAFAGMNVEVNYAGSGNNSYVWADLLINSQTAALLFSKLAILMMALLLLRSFVGGLAIVIPVVITTIIVAGMAGWLGIPMDVSTALAAGIAIGVGVDYAVHYVYRYKENRLAGQAHAQAVVSTMKGVGRTIVFNAVVVSAGFAVLLLSQFPPHAKLGVFVVVYMIISCLVAMLVLPVILERYAVR